MALREALKCRITMWEFSVVFAPGAPDLSGKKSCSLLRGRRQAGEKSDRGVAPKTFILKENA